MLEHRRQADSAFFFETEPIRIRISLVNVGTDERTVRSNVPALTQTITGGLYDQAGIQVPGNRVHVDEDARLRTAESDTYATGDVVLPAKAWVYWTADINTAALPPGVYEARFRTSAGTTTNGQVVLVAPNFAFELRATEDDDLAEVSRRELWRAVSGNDFVSARTAAARLLRFNPMSIEAHIALGDMAKREGRLTQAQEEYRQALSNASEQRDLLFLRRAARSRVDDTLEGIRGRLNAFPR
jgi:hypothetical protein